MKNLKYKLSLIILCFIFFQACQDKPQEVSKIEPKLVKTCDTTYTNSEITKNKFSTGNLNQKPTVQFSKAILSNLHTLRDTLYNIEDLEIYGDSIMDVNDDGHLDLVLESYAAAGFGTKYLHSVYLFNPKTKLFVKIFNSFLNVAFSPETKTFTSIYFGRGHISGDKYRWEGMSFIKIETATMTNYVFCEIENRLEGKITSIQNCSECIPKEYLNYLELQ